MISNLSRWLAWVVIIVSIVALSLHIGTWLLKPTIWDDAFMWVRYAHNVLSNGAIAWNGSVPSFGITSHIVLMVVIPFVLFGFAPVATMLSASMVGVLLFAMATLFLIASIIPAKDRDARLIAAMFVFAILALNATRLGPLTASGMDTMYAVAYAMLYIGLLMRYSITGTWSRLSAVYVGVIAAVAYLIRPELLVYSAFVPLSIALLSDSAHVRMRARESIVASLGAFLCILVALFLYYGTPLPLTFYAKSGGLYGPGTLLFFKYESFLQFLTYIESYRLLFVSLGAFLFLKWRTLFTRRTDAALTGVLLAAGVSLSYSLFFVFQVMGAHGRFYYPTLPALIVMCIVVAHHAAKYFEEKKNLSSVIVVVSLLLLSSLYTPLASGAQNFGYAVMRHGDATNVAWQGSAFEYYKSIPANGYYWTCLDAFAALPSDASLATTEVGMPGILAIDKKVIDLAGLNDGPIAIERIPLAERIMSEQIDFVYIPTFHYPEMRDSIRDSADFNRDYEIYSGSRVHSQGDIAVRMDSPYRERLAACLEERARSMNGPHVEDEGTYYLSLPYPILK